MKFLTISAVVVELTSLAGINSRQLVKFTDQSVSTSHVFWLSENQCAILPLPSKNEAGRLVVQHEADPEPSTFLRKDEDYG